MSLLSLTFLAPAALLGLLALAIPIYLHMRHKPRAESFKFPAIEFLLKAQKKRKRRFRVEQWLLMAFRLLVIGLLAFLFAKPFVDRQFGENAIQGNQPLVILLDDSASMMAGKEPFFNLAVAEIRDALAARGGGSPTRLVLASNPAQWREAVTAAALRDVLPRLKPVTYAAVLDDAYREALDIIAREGWQQATVRIFTDGSRTAWRELPTTRPEKVDVLYSSLREVEPDFRNVALAEVAQSPGDANSIEVSLLNSAETAADVSVRVRAPGSVNYRQRVRVDARSGASHRFALDDSVPPKLTVSLEDDSFALDNQIVFAPRANKRIRILIIDGDSHPEAVRNESFFFRNALGADESGQYGYQLDVVTPAGLTAEKARQYDGLYALNVSVPATEIFDEALAAGKGVFIAMGDRVDFERWNPFLSRLGLQVWEVQALDQAVPLNLERFDHPMFRPIEETAWRGYMERVAVERYRITTTDYADFDTPVKLMTGAPLLLTRDLKPGRLMIWTTSMDLDWNNFPLEFGFVPFVRQIIAHLSGQDSDTAYQTYTTTQLVEMDLIDSLNLKYTAAGVADLDAAGPKPGVYTRSQGGQTQFVQVSLDPRELDFQPFESPAQEGRAGNPLEELGFRSFIRADLAPYAQWLLFLLILVETVVAARVTLNWGAR